MTKRLFVLQFLVLTAVLVGFVVSMVLGTSIYSASEIFNSLLNGSDENLRNILLEVRLPRALTAILVGMALAQVGWILQATFSNPLADPALIGISPIAAIGVVLAFSIGSLSFGIIFGFSLLLLALSYLAALKLPSQKFILAAFAFGSLSTAGLGVLTASPLNTSGKSLTAWIFGSISTVNLEQTSVLAFFVILATLILTRQSEKLDLLSLGERTAANIGVDVNKERFKVFVTASLLLAPTVAIGGVISFVGLAIPLFARELIPGRHKSQHLLVIGLGGFAVLCADIISKMAFSPVEIPLGITLAVLGAPIMFRSLLKGDAHV